MNKQLKSNELYKRITLDLIRRECKDWLIKHHIMSKEDIKKSEKDGHDITKEYMNSFCIERLDWCKMYPFDQDNFDPKTSSPERDERLKLYNFRNTIAFNQSIMNLREAGIYLPDCDAIEDSWPDYTALRQAIETGEDQLKIIELFHVVFAEYAALPDDVDMSDPIIDLYRAIAGLPYHVYWDHTLSLEEYENGWSIQIGKEWLKKLNNTYLKT